MFSRSGVAQNALVVIAVLLSGYALYGLRGIVTPLALALFLVVMVDGFARELAKRVRFLPEWAALPVALVLTALAVGLTVYAVAANAATFGAQLFDAAPRLNAPPSIWAPRPSRAARRRRIGPWGGRGEACGARPAFCGPVVSA